MKIVENEKIKCYKIWFGWKVKQKHLKFWKKWRQDTMSLYLAQLSSPTPHSDRYNITQFYASIHALHPCWTTCKTKANLIWQLYRFPCYIKKLHVSFKGSRKYQKPKPGLKWCYSTKREHNAKREDLAPKLLLKDQLYFKW